MYLERIEKTNEDLKKILRYLRRAASMGHTDAQFRLAGILIKGSFGAKQDTEQGLWYLKKAAGQNHLKAIYYLGCMHLEGTVAKKNVPEGKRLLELATETGYVEAHFRLACWYLEATRQENLSNDQKIEFKERPHEGTERGLFHLTRAAELNFLEAIFMLGCLHLEGLGVYLTKNTKMGIQLLTKAADQGHVMSLFKLGQIFSDVKDNKAICEGIEEAGLKEGEAVVFFKKAAELGHIESQFQLGEIYSREWMHSRTRNHWNEKKQINNDENIEPKNVPSRTNSQERTNFESSRKKNSEGTKNEINLAIEYFELAGEQGHLLSLYRLAVLYVYGGQGVVQDESKAFSYLNRMVGLGQVRDDLQSHSLLQPQSQLQMQPQGKTKRALAQAHFILSEFYKNGSEGVVLRDLGKEVWHLQKASLLGLSLAKYRLAIILLRNSEFPSKTSEEKFAPQKSVSTRPSVSSEYDLFEVPVDFSRGIEFLRQSAEEGLSEAQLHMASFLLVGAVVPRDREKAMKYLSMAASQGVVEAIHNYCILSLHDLEQQETLKPLCGGDKDGWQPVEASGIVRRLRELADGGFQEARINLGLMFLSGTKSIEKDENLGIDYLEKASKEGSIAAKFHLGTFYLEKYRNSTNVGRVDECLTKGLINLRDAGRAGHEDAQQFLLQYFDISKKVLLLSSYLPG
eukprot:TRINITY_DN11972_c0_g1_i3.p1 TRINITY_DN11972_c0_g1~~TRINITY_DN11972_c0_g1_i3.p1  ORF type:complete len:684 (-),score=153.86 TRINITY_DN11972_c0_g1_i3:404-2455(-)